MDFKGSRANRLGALLFHIVVAVDYERAPAALRIFTT